MRTQAQWLALMKSKMAGLLSNLDVDYGPVQDFSSTPGSYIAALLDAEISRLSSILDLDNYADMTDVEFTAMLNNFLLSVLPGTYAIGTVYFRTANFISDVIISRGFPISTANTPAITFYATSTVTMPVASKTLYYNTTLGLYEVPVPIQCASVGSVGIVAAGAINTLIRSISQISSVTNKDATSLGLEVETPAQSIQRYKAFLKAVGMISIADGILEGALGFVPSALVINANNPNFDRTDHDSGAVDVYILGDNLVQAIDNFRVGYGFNERIANNVAWIFENQPVEQLVSVIIGGIDFTSSFELVKDTGITSGSQNAQDSLVCLDTTMTDQLGETATVAYKYNGLVGNMQSQFDSPSYYVQGRDLLIREAIEKGIYLSATLTVNPGYDFRTVVGLIKTNLLNAINALTLGVNLDEADAIFVAKSTPGVDNFVLTNLRLKTESSGTVHDLVAASSEYFRIDPNDLVVG